MVPGKADRICISREMIRRKENGGNSGSGKEIRKVFV
jgi:hypothetical protein